MESFVEEPWSSQRPMSAGSYLGDVSGGAVHCQTIKESIVKELLAHLPPIFAGSHIGELTGGAIHWPTIQNKRSLKEIPEECFAYSGRRVLVRRDPFLKWWGGTLSEGRPTSGRGA